MTAPGSRDEALARMTAALEEGALDVQGTVADQDPDSGNPVKIGGKYTATLPTLTDGDRSDLHVDSRGVLIVGGAVLHDAVDSGNPVKIGGKASSSQPTSVSAGDRVDGLFSPRGALATASLVSDTGMTDALANTAANLQQALNGFTGAGAVAPVGFNGTSWDRVRNNVAASYLASAARTATPVSADITTYNARGIRVSVNVTAVTGTPSVVPTVEVKDAVAGTYAAILTGAAITGTGHVELVVMPGITPAANLAAAMAIARTMRVSMTHGNADSITYSVAVELLV